MSRDRIARGDFRGCNRQPHVPQRFVEAYAGLREPPHSTGSADRVPRLSVLISEKDVISTLAYGFTLDLTLNLPVSSRQAGAVGGKTHGRLRNFPHVMKADTMPDTLQS